MKSKKEKKEEFEKRVINTYFHSEIWEEFSFLVVNDKNVLFAAFCLESDARDFILKNEFNNHLKIVKLDYEKLED